jgi:anti-anti-sigma regulatory factor
VFGLAGPAVVRAQSYLAPLLRQNPPILGIDMSGLHGCDPTGALMLMVAARVAADCGGQIRLAAPPATVGRVLRQAGTLRVARVYTTVYAAVRADRHDLLAAPHCWTSEAATLAIHTRR